MLIGQTVLTTCHRWFTACVFCSKRRLKTKHPFISLLKSLSIYLKIKKKMRNIKKPSWVTIKYTNIILKIVNLESWIRHTWLQFRSLFQLQNNWRFLHFGYVGESSHFHKPVEKPASATYHSPPSEAYSWLSASYSQLEAVKPLFFASLYIWEEREREREQNKTKKKDPLSLP